MSQDNIYQFLAQQRLWILILSVVWQAVNHFTSGDVLQFIRREESFHPKIKTPECKLPQRHCHFEILGMTWCSDEDGARFWMATGLCNNFNLFDVSSKSEVLLKVGRGFRLLLLHQSFPFSWKSLAKKRKTLCCRLSYVCVTRTERQNIFTHYSVPQQSQNLAWPCLHSQKRQCNFNWAF